MQSKAIVMFLALSMGLMSCENVSMLPDRPEGISFTIEDISEYPSVESGVHEEISVDNVYRPGSFGWDSPSTDSAWIVYGVAFDLSEFPPQDHFYGMRLELGKLEPLSKLEEGLPYQNYNYVSEEDFWNEFIEKGSIDQRTERVIMKFDQSYRNGWMAAPDGEETFVKLTKVKRITEEDGDYLLLEGKFEVRLDNYWPEKPWLSLTEGKFRVKLQP